MDIDETPHPRTIETFGGHMVMRQALALRVALKELGQALPVDDQPQVVPLLAKVDKVHDELAIWIARYGTPHPEIPGIAVEPE